MQHTELEDLLDSLKFSYMQYKSVVSKNSATDIAYMQGFCISLEDVLEVCFGVSRDTIVDIRKDILGKIPLIRRDPTEFIEIVSI